MPTNLSIANDASPSPQPACPPSVTLADVARARLVACLRSAIARIETHGADLDPVREALEDARYRIDALLLADALPAPAAARREMLIAAASQPVAEFLLIPFGRVAVERAASGEDFEFTRAHAESAQRWFASLGRKLAIDYEHQSFDRFNTRSDGLRPAAGWIGGLEARDDGLWATDVTWTERAAALLRAGEYRYFSPVIYWTDEACSDVAALGPVALTNDPAMRRVQPLAARRGADWPPPHATDNDAGAEFAALLSELDATRAELSALGGRLEEVETERLIDVGLRDGRVLECDREFWRGELRRDPQRAGERLRRAPVLLAQGRVLEVDARGQIAPLREAASPAAAAHAVEPDDLRAYERARAAGRVQGAR